jgi:hypothetical protein
VADLKEQANAPPITNLVNPVVFDALQSARLKGVEDPVLPMSTAHKRLHTDDDQQDFLHFCDSPRARGEAETLL